MNSLLRRETHTDGPRAAKRQRLYWVLAVAAAAIALAACSGSNSPPASTSGDANSSTEGSFPISLYQGEETLGEAEFDFSVLLTRGKPVVLNFWAGLCPACRAEMLSFQSVYEEHADDLILIGVDIGPFVGLGSVEDGTNLLQELGVAYPTGQALSAQAVRQFSILSMPTTIFYDASGQEVSRHTGFITEGQLRGEIEELLSAQS